MDEIREKIRRYIDEKFSHGSALRAAELMLLTGMPEASPFALELDRWADEGRITEKEFYAVIRKLTRITSQLRMRRELTEKEVIEITNTAEVAPLLEAVRRENEGPWLH
jgi:hypothetical protein